MSTAASHSVATLLFASCLSRHSNSVLRSWALGPQHPFVSRCRHARAFCSSSHAMAPKTSIQEFQDLLVSSHRVLALCGAGLSASSGLPTFRGAGGLWRNHDPTSLATPDAFEEDPALVWFFYAWRRHMALQAQPNAGHRALADLAKTKGNAFLCLTQNVDGLSTRAGHPSEQLRLLHGSILDLKCSSNACAYIDRDNLDDPLCPALEAAASTASSNSHNTLLDPNTPIPKINPKTDLPHCPECAKKKVQSLLRPGVVWFGESLDSTMLREVDDWVENGGPKIDIMLVIGTAAVVYPAAGYTRQARKKGAVVVVVNPDPESSRGLTTKDFWFQGDAAEILPQLFATVTQKK